MQKVTLDGSGREYEVIASPLTLMIYEQEFSTDKAQADLIKDVYGRIDLSKAGSRQLVTAEYVENRLQEAMADGKTLPKTTRDLIAKAFPAYVETVVDFTTDNWTAYVRALWAMLRAADELEATADPMHVPQADVSFKAWVAKAGMLDMDKVTTTVLTECQSGFFPSRR